MKLGALGGAVLVDYVFGSEATVLTTLATYAPDDAAAGLGMDDTVQLVTGLSVLRSAVSAPAGGGRFALYDADGVYRGVQLIQGQEMRALYDAQIAPVAIVGDNPLFSPPAGAGLPEDWGTSLALAIDQVIVKLKDARTAGSPQGTLITVGLALPTMAVIVAGVAVAVIGTVAAWRYLDPQARASIQAVTQAAEAYRMRIETYHATGTMPPASELEKGAADTVNGLADERRKSTWTIVAATVGGGVVATVGLAALRRALQ